MTHRVDKLPETAWKKYPENKPECSGFYFVRSTRLNYFVDYWSSVYEEWDLFEKDLVVKIDAWTEVPK